MTDNPIRDRTSPLCLSEYYVFYYRIYLHWLRYLLERLGSKPTLSVWDRAFADKDNKLLENILSSGWIAVAAKDGLPSAKPVRTQIENETGEKAQSPKKVEQEIEILLNEYFQPAFEGVTFEEARRILERTTPFYQINKHFKDLNVVRDCTAYEAIHLFQHGIACLAEALIDLHGKRGEFIAYDAILADIEAQKGSGMSVADFMAKRLDTFRNASKSQDLFTAALERKIGRASDKEINWTVRECEFARYYRKHHPRVGYLLACSSDNALYQSFNPDIRLQLSSSLMEGDDMCRYKIYSIERRTG